MKLPLPRGAVWTTQYLNSWSPTYLRSSISLQADVDSRQPCCSRRYTSDAAASLQGTRTAQQTKPPTPSTQHTTTTTASSPSLPDQVRLLMRRVPYPVAIITATDPSGPLDTSAFRGMTVSSFNTVTLTPQPVISFNVRRPSETLNALLASRRFLVHLLSPGPATATLARDFSKGNTTLASMLGGHGEFEFEGLAADPEMGIESERPLPILRRRHAIKTSVDFPFVFECALHANQIDIHDHSIVLGTVIRTIQSVDTALASTEGDSEDLPDRLCLTYANTRFWKMGSQI
ncbi:hypothetical protein N7474_006657 [Penicillium riverlandense]|uniref:uncharacterized protein n=1 Tax=Penicillium riverlandense TaxID=1903569 RepID=UPI0025481BDA|nr:uncharacterized protein N7474_006657 [Penicillium riverlandense]KAJ5814880.1 hypothetical protein N7474_006657 [Penicillium riverlandense]